MQRDPTPGLAAGIRERAPILDLQKLKIDRPESSASGRRRAAGPGLGTLVFVAIVVGGGWIFRRPIATAVDRLRLPVVQIFEVVKPSRMAASAVSGTSANGYVVARNRAALSADTPGRVIEMNVEEGSVVKRGDVVARLFSDEYAAAVRRSESELEVASVLVETRRAQVSAAEADLEVRRMSARESEARLADAAARRSLAITQRARAARLVEQKVKTQEMLDEAEAELLRSQATHAAGEAAFQSAQLSAVQSERALEVAQVGVREALARVDVQRAALDQARATLDKTDVRAPFDGVVILKDAEVGEVVSPNAQGGGSSRGSVVTMVDFSSLEAQVEMPETNLKAVVMGGPANIYLDAFPEHVFRGKVQRIWPTANRQKATIEVRVIFLEPDERLRPEMGVRVVFSPGEQALLEDDGADRSPSNSTFWIPAACVARIDDAPGVFDLERDTARWRPIKEGPRRGDKIAILSGLSEGERLILDPPASLQDGDRVQTRE